MYIILKLTRLFAAIYPWADLSEIGKKKDSYSKCWCMTHKNKSKHIYAMLFYLCYSVVHLLRWSSCTSGCSQSLWNRRTLRRPAQPVGSSSVPAWWCLRSAGVVPTALGCPAQIHSGQIFTVKDFSQRNERGLLEICISITTRNCC